MNLQQHLDACGRFNAEYGGGLSNHLPMALVALDRLGATAEGLDAFARRYVRKLEPAPAATEWPADQIWTDQLGCQDNWPAYRSLFAGWLALESTGAVLSQCLPVLMAGCGAAAFHGLIRTAYAVQSGHTRELGDALAYWACRHVALGSTRGGGSAQPLELLAVIAADLADWSSDAALISERMREVSAAATFSHTVDQLQVNAETLPTLARYAAVLYAHSGNFTALHLVTSAHAMRLVLPFAKDVELHVGYYWRAYAAAFGASGVQAGEAAPILDWEVLTAKALLSDDDHLVKLAYSCREHEHFYGGKDWRLAASRAVAQAGGTA